jgi:Leucine-rich repeat (LRR) protein
MTSLIMSNNGFGNAMPTAIGLLTSLQRLQLNTNAFNFIPPEIGNLRALTSLYLYSFTKNQNSIPSTLGQLTNLEVLDIHSTNFAAAGGFPRGLGALTKLKILSAYYCNFKGLIPTEIGNMVSLENLFLGSNGFTNLPTEIGNLVKLNDLILDNNKFNTTLPEFVTRLTGLTRFAPYLSTFKGTIPASYSLLTNLQLLPLNDNKLTGSIPSSLFTINSMTNLDLHNNLLTGSIPSNIGTLTKLSSLLLQSNSLRGTIPASVSALTKVTQFDLSFNYLTMGGSSTLSSNAFSTAELNTMKLDNNCLAISFVTPRTYSCGAISSRCPPTGEKKSFFCSMYIH